MKYSTEMKIYRARCWLRGQAMKAINAAGRFIQWYNDFEYGDIDDKEWE